MTDTSQPLDDITVLDLSQAVAAPVATVLLADFGANVISIEPPEGGSEREYGNGSTLPSFGRNKRSVVIDLKDDEGAPVLHRLVEEADVLVHNFRPGKMAELNCDYETLSEVNPQLVYCSVTGYGESGPYKDRPGFDPLAQAMSGLMSITGEPDRKPSRIGASTIDIGTGLLTAFAIWPALRHARETGEGQKIEGALFDTAAFFMSHWYTTFSKTGDVPQRRGDSWDLYAPSGVFDTATDPIYMSAPFQYLWERFCEALGRDDWKDDPRFETNDDRLAHREELCAEVEEEFSKYEREEIVEKLLDAGVAAAELQEIGEAAQDEHLHQRGTVRPLEDVDGSEVLGATTPVKLSDTPGEIERRPPQLGEHTSDVLAEADFEKDEIERLFEAGVVEGE